ncbi:MAG: TatD family hydrolase [Leptolyngbyaceae bacterium]|nr:TatD family hydrolase [Leptolyngbyaceae bacterium]
MELIDTHVHLNFPVLRNEIQTLAQHWRDAGVVKLVHSCVEPGEFESIRSIADQFEEISFAVGLHPLDVGDRWTEETASEILALAQSDPRVVAIGETGLDFFKAENQAEQVRALKEQLAIARQLDLPVIIHCRDAAPKMRSVLQEFWAEYGAVQGVMHCWSGSAEETQWFLDLGFHISFSGILTFKNATQVHESARLVPDDRLLVETDCPFLTPVPYRGKKPNQPSYVTYVAHHLAQLKDVPVEHIAKITTTNASTLFQI